MSDCATYRVPAALLIPSSLQPQNVSTLAARLAHQFVSLNRDVLALADTEPRVEFDGANVSIAFTSSTTICSLPLRSPTSGRLEWALTVTPRFAWKGVGVMLSQMGWRVVPTIARLPTLPRSDESIPRWVISSIVLMRLRELLTCVERRFEVKTTIRSAPRGRVQWGRYASDSIARGRFLEVPCTFPDLTADRELRSAIHFTAATHAAALESEVGAGNHVRSLIAIAREIAGAVSDVPALAPGPSQLARLMRRTFGGEAYRAGLEAIEWTVDERGLAGPSDLSGLPWTLRMDAFFEAWGETIGSMLATLTGGRLRTGRRRDTLVPIHWEPPYSGSQRYLLPDLVLDRDDLTVIIDTKYKPHLEEINQSSWAASTEELRARHREDFLQALAYASLSHSARTVVCLAYPVSPETWESMRDRMRLIHRGSIAAGERRLDVALIAFPMTSAVRPVAEALMPLFTD